MGERSSARLSIRRLFKVYREIESEIVDRLDEFRETWKSGDDNAVFSELVFCLLTPQSKALSCAQAAARLHEKNLIVRGTAGRIARELKGVRFHNTKGQYIAGARRRFTKRGRLVITQRLNQFEDSFQRREWIVENVKGLGYKEASHFLRNIGQGEDFAILDRHILECLLELGIIDDSPRYVSRARYLDLEKRMREFARRIGIRMDHLDLLLWYVKTGIVFR